jgi:hypothetical protein
MEPTLLPPIDVYPPGQEPVEQPAENNPVALGTPSDFTQDQGVTLGGSLPTPPSLPTTIAKERANKIFEGIGERVQRTQNDIYDDIQAGHENTLRQMAASDMNVENHKRKLNMLSDLANQKGGPLDEREVATVMDPFNPWNKPVDPDSVVEKQYATKYINTLQVAVDTFANNRVKEAQQEIPEQTNEAFLKGSDLTAKMEAFKRLREDIEAEIGKQSVPSYGADLLKQMFQPYTEYKMRGNVPEVGTFTGGILIGENMQAQADFIFGLPLEESIKRARMLTDIIRKDNPQLAAKFAGYLEGLPATDRILDNAFTIMAPLDYASMGKLGFGLARKITLNNQANTAVRQLVKAADQIGTDAAKRAEVVGDVGKAAEIHSSGLILDNIAGKTNPIDAVTEPLLTMMNQSKEKLATDPGNLRTELVRRIQDQYEASGKNFIQKIVDAARINRIPMPLAVANSVKIIRNAVADYYPGIRNAILDISNPLYEARSNTFWHEITFGNFDGTLFSNPKTAKNYADLHGLDATIVEGRGPITNAEIQTFLDRRVQLNKNLNAADEAIEANRVRMNNKDLPDADRAIAKEQYEGLSDHKKAFTKEIKDIDLRLKGKETYDRVTNLQSQVERLRLENQQTRARLKTSGEDAFARAIIKDNQRQIAQHVEEMKAIKSGKADVIGSNKATIEQQGVGFKLVVRRPLVETDKAVRDLMIRDVDGKLIPEATSLGSKTGFKAMMNATLNFGKFRSAEDTLSLNELIQRKVGTYTQSIFKEWANKEAQYIRQVASGVIRNDPVTGAPIPYWQAKPKALYSKLTGEVKENYNAFVRTLDHARDAKDPDTGKPGYFFQTPGELNNHYLKYFDRSPTFVEHQAYNAFIRMVEGDRIMREIAEFRNRARVGTEQWSIGARGPKGVMTKSDYFDGIKMKYFPGGDDVMMIMGRRIGDERIINLGGAGIGPRQLEEYRKAVEEGRLTVIRVYAPEHKPLRTFSDKAGNEHVRYILTENADSKPMEFTHVNRRGGGHFEYDYDHFLKQANMYHQYENVDGVKGRYRSVYVGDTTFMPLLNRVMGSDIAGKMHEVQRLLREGDIAGAKAWTEAHLPIEFEKLHDMFKSGRDELGKETSPLLDLNEPFVVVPKGKTILDMGKDLERRYGKSFKDAAKSGSDNKQFQVAYNTERESFGIEHLEDIGTQGNPIYKYDPAGSKMVDPITTMNKALNRITQSVFMDDYKIYAVEHWLREAEGHLKALDGEIQASPFWHFINSKDASAFKSGTAPEIINNLLANRYKIQQFIGIPSSADTAIHSAKQALVDWSYQKYGPESARSLGQKAITIAPNWMLAHIHDPITFLRSMTFHEKLGLFNPAQMLVQAQTFATILSISPFHGTAGTYAAMLHAWAGMNRSPEILKALDNMATKMNVFGQSKWRPGEFLESLKTYEKTGFGNVAGEYANLNTALKTDFVGSDFKSLLNGGLWFFQQGERSQRVGGWHTAFREFREANPTGPITQADIGKILQRADLLTVNMSRASNSMMNSGVLSLTTQFLTYQIRLAELFMSGSRLGATLAERNLARLRMFTFYSALYGAPSAVGLSGLPLQDSIRQEAIRRGYTPGDNWLSTAVDLGIPTMIAAHLTGGKDLNWQKGNLYNFGDRLGSPGFTQFNDALRSSHPWWQLLAGAAGTTLIDLLTSGSNFWRSMGSMLKQNQDRQFPSKWDDIIDVAKNVSAFNQGWKFATAVTTGNWKAKNEANIGKVSVANAAFMSFFGLSPQEQDNARILSSIREGDVDRQKYIMNEAVKEQRRGYQNQALGNRSEAIKNFTRASTLMDVGGFDTQKRASMYSIATQGQNMIDDKDYEYAFGKNVPAERSDFMGIPMPFTTQTDIPQTRVEQFRTKGRLNQLRQQ